MADAYPRKRGELTYEGRESKLATPTDPPTSHLEDAIQPMLVRPAQSKIARSSKTWRTNGRSARLVIQRGMTRALTARKELRRGKPRDHVFVDPDGNPFDEASLGKLAETFRDSVMVSRYAKHFENAAELKLGRLRALDKAIPELVEVAAKNGLGGSRIRDKEKPIDEFESSSTHLAEVAEWQTRRIQNPLSVRV
jgi:hypothetical protein